MNTINSYESAMTTIVDIDLELNKMYAEIRPGRKLPACINSTALDTLLAKAQSVFSSLVRPQHADELDMERYTSCIVGACRSASSAGTASAPPHRASPSSGAHHL